MLIKMPIILNPVAHLLDAFEKNIINKEIKKILFIIRKVDLFFISRIRII
jgi:hypothetical protein